MLFGQPVSVVFRSDQWKKKKCQQDRSEPRGIAAMRHTFHHPALTTCGAALPPGKKYVAVRYLTKELVFFVVDIKSKGQEVFDDACKYLGLQDTELFGLAFIHDDEYIFIDLNLKISKYAVKSWKTADFGIGGDGHPLLVLYLRVKHYVDFHLLISEKVARHHYYLQMRENVRSYSQALSEEKAFLLAALALQADLGNYSEQRHKGKYFEISSYFPAWIANRIGDNYIAENIPALHKDNAGLSRGEAQVGYIREASDSTAPHNLHFYKVRRRKGKSWQPVWLGIRDSGITIYEQPDTQNTKSLLSVFLWHDIAKLHFERKKFEILSEGSPECRKFTYYAGSEELAKNLLWMCRTTHHFHMSNEARVQELKKLRLEGEKTYRESYIYTDQHDLEREEKQKSASQKVNRTWSVSGGCDTTGNCTGNTYPRFGQNGFNLDDSKCNTERSKDAVLTCPVAKSMNRSMEVLPLSQCSGMLSQTTRYKSQSIACFSHRALVACSPFAQENLQSALWSPSSSTSLSITPTSTLLSQSSCTSCTDSACSSLSLASGSTVKATSSLASKAVENHHWIKCDSFEELPVGAGGVESKSLPHKICISTFKDSHVRTASLYDAVSVTSKPNVRATKSSSTSQATTSKQTYSVCSPGVGHTYSKPSFEPIPEPGSVQLGCSVPSTVPRKNVSIQNIHSSSTSKSADSGTHIYSRTATRIGVSSLSRDQRLPLTLFSNRGRITACGSEPNLYNFVSSDNQEYSADLSPDAEPVQRKRGMHARKPNSRSELCLSVLGRNANEINLRLCEFSNRSQAKTPESGSEIEENSCSEGAAENVDCVDNADFPCIPPPPAYRNCADEESCSSSEPSSPEQKIVTIPKGRNETQHIPRSVSDVHQELRSCLSSPADVLDLQQLRRKSQALDLPLISALCNDRSLLMLPKTVPTCSRQRHVGNNDPLRFARGYSANTGCGSMADLTGTYPARPVSWHVGPSLHPLSSDNPRGNSWYQQNVTSVANAKGPSSAGVKRQCLPPTILTSFSKTPEKQCSADYSSTDYRLDKIQMIPMKLMANNITNGRVHQKGSSS